MGNEFQNSFLNKFDDRYSWTRRDRGRTIGLYRNYGLRVENSRTRAFVISHIESASPIKVNSPALKLISWAKKRSSLAHKASLFSSNFNIQSKATYIPLYNFKVKFSCFACLSLDSAIQSFTISKWLRGTKWRKTMGTAIFGTLNIWKICSEKDV